MSRKHSERQLTDDERATLQKRTARAVRLLWSFQDLPVQVGEPCDVCGGLYWWITGSQRIAPSGYCLNCRPGEIENRPTLRKMVADSALDTLVEEVDTSTDDVPDLPDQLTLF